MPSSLGIVASGVQGFSPLDLSPALWLDASDTSTLTASSGAVSVWADKSGNGKNISQSTSTAQPGTGTNKQNGLNIITFDGGDYLSATTASDWKFLHDGTKWIAACAAKAGAVSNPNAAYSIISTNGDYTNAERGAAWWFDDRAGVSRNNGTVLFASNASASYQHLNVGSDVWTPNTFVVASLTADLANVTAANRSAMFVNNSAAVSNNTATGTVSASNPTRVLSVGGSVYGFNLVGSIAEIIIVSGANATEANRVLLRDYLNAKWAVY